MNPKSFMLSVCLTIASVAVIYFHVQIEKKWNQDKLDRLYRNAREAYNRAAGLKDAEAPTFGPNYDAATAAVGTYEEFEDHNVLDLTDMRNANSRAVNLKVCLTLLQSYRSSNSQQVKVRFNQDIAHCLKDGSSGRLPKIN